MPDPTPLSTVIRLVSRAVRAAVRAPRLNVTRVEGRQVFGQLNGQHVELSSCRHVELYVLDDAGLATYAGPATPTLRTQYRAAFLVATLALTACADPSVVVTSTDQPASQLDVYVVTATAPTEQGQRIVEAIAHCEEGDAIIAGMSDEGEHEVTSLVAQADPAAARAHVGQLVAAWLRRQMTQAAA